MGYMQGDSETTVDELKGKVRKFCEDREWDQYHNAKDLAIDIITEAAELLEPFRFKSAQEVEEIMNDPIRSHMVKEELADVAIGVLRLAQRYKIDLSVEVADKLVEAAKKYPVGKFRGSNKKYNEL